MSPLALRRGFTLIELMVVVAIVGILSAIALPKFTSMLQKSRDGTTKANLGAIRSAISLYYGEHTFFPGECAYHDTNSSILLNALVPKYVSGFPATRTAAHAEATTVYVHWVDPAYGNGITTIHDGANAWMYASECDGSGNRVFPSGQFLVECSHTDSKLTTWSKY